MIWKKEIAPLLIDRLIYCKKKGERGKKKKEKRGEKKIFAPPPPPKIKSKKKKKKITASAATVENLRQMRRRSRVEIQNFVLNPLASAEVVLTEQKEEMGVAVCDIGGGTTDLAIYVDGNVWHTMVLAVAATISPGYCTRAASGGRAGRGS